MLDIIYNNPCWYRWRRCWCSRLWWLWKNVQVQTKPGPPPALRVWHRAAVPLPSVSLQGQTTLSSQHSHSTQTQHYRTTETTLEFWRPLHRPILMLYVSVQVLVCLWALSHLSPLHVSVHHYSSEYWKIWIWVYRICKLSWEYLYYYLKCEFKHVVNLHFMIIHFKLKRDYQNPCNALGLSQWHRVWTRSSRKTK